MVDNKYFWWTIGTIVGLLHVAGIVCYLWQGLDNPVTKIWLIILGIHVLEMPMAAIALQNKRIAAPTTLFKTLVFGFTWWVPARRGIYDN